MWERLVATGLLLAALGSCASTSGDATAEIRTIADTYQTAYNEHDSSAYGELRAADADAIILDIPQTLGRDAILRAQQAFWESSPTTRMTLTVSAVRFLSPDVAIVDFARHGEVENRGTWIVVRQDGEWLIRALRVMPAARTPS